MDAATSGSFDVDRYLDRIEHEGTASRRPDDLTFTEALVRREDWTDVLRHHFGLDPP